MMKKFLFRYIGQLLACLLVCFLACTAWLPATVQATAQDKVVRVGWFQSDMFQEGMTDSAVKSGYCYDYLHKVADYTTWHYKYVYGEWPELFHKLETGEIDFLAGVSVTEERKKYMLFPDIPMGQDQYYLYKHANDVQISINDPASFVGKRVGAIRNNRMTTFMEQWVKDNHVPVEIVYFDGFEAQNKAFAEGKVDLLTQTLNNVLSQKNIAIVTKVGEEPFYMAVSQKRPELLSQLNTSLATMISLDPFILQNLQYENYGAKLTTKTLTADEIAWLAAHPSIKVGYLDNKLPYCAHTPDGQVTGIIKDVFTAMPATVGQQGKLKQEFRAYATYDAMLKALKANEVDVIFPVYGDAWDLEQDGIDASNSVVTGREILVYKGTYTKEKLKRLAVNTGNKLQHSLTQKVFPQAELVGCASAEACLDLVLEGKADGTVINSLRTALVTGNYKYRSLAYIQLPKNNAMCFGVNENNPTLLILLNRGLRLLGPNYGMDAANKYNAMLYKYTLADFVRQNALWLGCIMLAIGFLIIGLLVFTIQRQHKNVLYKEAMNKILQENQVRLEETSTAAQAANRAKTTFLFNMSHDIRTPMNAIIGFTELLKKHLNEPDKVTDYLMKIEASSKFLLSLINDVLEMARIESGNTTLNEEPCQLKSFTESIVDVFSEQMQKKQLQFTCNIQVEHDRIYCDPVKVREILLNLVSNAYKYTPEGGAVTLEIRELPSIKPGCGYYQIQVADTGIGMSADFLPHLFEEFTRERTATENQIEGTGLGMPIVKKLVELMGGTIAVASELGKGTTFVLNVNLRLSAEEAPAETTDEKLDLTRLVGKRILLAEDNELNAEIATEILMDAGFQVEHAADGAICLEMLQRAAAGYYAVILMDIQMPNMDGYAATRAIRGLADKTKAEIPILAMTANAFAEDRENSLKAGMNGHLAKPIDVQMLLHTLAQLL